MLLGINIGWNDTPTQYYAKKIFSIIFSSHKALSFFQQ